MIAHAFPCPSGLAALHSDELRRLGFSRPRAVAMIELARSISNASLYLERLADLPDGDAAARLCGMRGAGRWTSEYVLLRGLGRTNVFPGSVADARNNLRRWLHLPRALDDAAVRRILARWRPYGGLVYFHLLLDRLAEAGSWRRDRHLAPRQGVKEQNAGSGFWWGKWLSPCLCMRRLYNA